MLPKLKISAFLLQRLERVKQQCSGCLFGVFYGEGTLLLMSFNVESTIGQLNYEQIQQKFPAELDLCGLVKFGECSDAEAHLTEIFKDVDITDNPILLQCEVGTLVRPKASIFMHSKLQEMPYDIMEIDELYRDFCFTRLKCHLDLYTDNSAQAIRRDMQSLRKMISCGSLAFQVQSTKVFITNANVHGGSTMDAKKHINGESLIDDIIQSIIDAVRYHKDDKENNSTAKKKGAGDIALSNLHGAIGCNYDIININVLQSKTRERNTIDTNVNNLITMGMKVRQKEFKFCVPLEIETMAILSKKTVASRLYDVLIESICRSLRLYEQSLIEKFDDIETAQLLVPTSYHFYPQEFGHFIACSYLDGITDDDSGMLERRKRLHRHFGLAVTRPYFRRSNHCVYRTELLGESPLLNTHLGVRASGITDGKQYLLQGNYYYYHYLQQNMQDKGWGCAYRSLQTLCSWFLLQGYTERDVPTHKEIQQYLVRVGDKQSNFIDSSQWIGSTEVSMCLQGLLNVESKILHVKSGNELGSLASDLAMHFQAQGTPVMIGGGVLAHTIIGIDYCVQTGDVKFLILDPHYTGGEDLHIIQSKGWCGWKGVDFWDKRSYYNLCMPQRPNLF